MEEYIANGCKLGWLIDPDKQQVHIYRSGQPAQVLDNPATVSGDPELPGFVLDLKPVWHPV
jgi:Uma2 family endonuclease